MTSHAALSVYALPIEIEYLLSKKMEKYVHVLPHYGVTKKLS